jgi:hypothetical protein
LQYEFPFQIRRTLRLSRVEQILQRSGAVDPIPSRPTLIAMIEDGTLDGKFVPSLNCYVVYVDSFHEWVESYAGMPMAA